MIDWSLRLMFEQTFLNIDDVLWKEAGCTTDYQQKLAALNELRQSILQKAFAGELITNVDDPTIEAAEESVAA